MIFLTLHSYIRAMRIPQWWKNVFVLAGPFFTRRLDDLWLLLQTVALTAAFCLISSAGYIINDLFDRKVDRLHPVKKTRPIAAGEISAANAAVFSLLLWSVGAWIALAISKVAFLFVLAYTLLNLSYSLRLKHVVLVDAFAISFGFILRVLTGTIGVGIRPSGWVIMCTGMITLFLAFAKRRAEALVLEKDPESMRAVLEEYTPSLLDSLISITAAGVILSYGIYASSPDTIALHGTANLIVTLPCVIYAVFRYLYLLHRWKIGEDPAVTLAHDPHILFAVTLWALLVLYLVWYLSAPPRPLAQPRFPPSLPPIEFSPLE